MANLRLKKQILEIVDNQLRENNPPCTKWAYRQLLEADYTEKEAKEKLGAVVLEEIYDVLKNKEPFDEERFEAAVMDMVQKSIDFEDDSFLPSGWEHINELIEKGQEFLEKEDYSGMTASWMEAWKEVRENLAEADGRLGVSGLDEAADYDYDLEGWLQDVETELYNAEEHELRLQFCREVLEAFDWEYEDDGGFKIAIGESLYALGRQEEGRSWFETWLKKEPHQVDAVNGFVMCLVSDGKLEEAFGMVERELKNQSCTFDNDVLFLRAVKLAQILGEEEKLAGYKEQYMIFEEKVKNMDFSEDDIFGDFKDPFCRPDREAGEDLSQRSMSLWEREEV